LDYEEFRMFAMACIDRQKARERKAQGLPPLPTTTGALSPNHNNNTNNNPTNGPTSSGASKPTSDRRRQTLAAVGLGASGGLVAQYEQQHEHPQRSCVLL
jgi:hypothetical protein